MKDQRQERTAGGCHHGSKWSECEECKANKLAIEEIAGSFSLLKPEVKAFAMASRIYELEAQIKSYQEATQ